MVEGKLTAKERNIIDCKRRILELMKPNIVYTFAVVYELMERRYGEPSIRRAMKLLVEEKSLRQWEEDTIFYYELPSSRRVSL